MYIDTHCHLQFEQYKDDLAMILGNAKKAGVKQFIVPGVDSLSSKLAVKLSQHYPEVVFASVGFHPYEASHNPDISILNNLSPIIAIGEIGLDYHLFKGEAATGKKQEQKTFFEDQLRIALQRNLPVIMHCRDAYDDFFDVLDNLPATPPGVIHCFSGGLQEIREAKRRGLYVGIDGNVTYSRQLQQIVPEIPLEILLLETDAPYLTPVPHRGIRNEPKYIPLIAQKIAELKHMTRTQIETRTSINAQMLFQLS